MLFLVGISAKRPAILLAIYAVALLGGCRQQQADTSTPVNIEEYGKLPGLRSSGNIRLREELHRVIEEGGTPEQLSTAKLPPQDNTAAVLQKLFPPEPLIVLWGRSGKILPASGFQFDPLRLQKALDFCEQYAAQRREVHAALKRPGCELGICFTAGFAADLGSIDMFRLAARWEAFQAAGALADNRLADAVDALANMLRLAACLAAEKHPVARFEAAALRSEALRVAEAIVQHDKVSRREIDPLCDLFCRQLADWPSDAEIWIGDRALGMHLYELVRRGDVTALLTVAERERFHLEGNLREFAEAAARNVDRDELYYLETMRKVIESCWRPYFARVTMLDDIDSDLQRRENTPLFPLVAGRLLLPGVRSGQLLQARDRAYCSAWALALTTAAGRDSAQYRTNPVTGKPFRQSQEGGQIVVSGIGTGSADRPVQVPAFRGDEPAP